MNLFLIIGTVFGKCLRMCLSISIMSIFGNLFSVIKSYILGGNVFCQKCSMFSFWNVVSFPPTELGEAELREVVAARLGPNGEAVLQNMINTNKAELFITNEGTPSEAAYVRIKSYQWRNEQGLRVDQTFQGVQNQQVASIDLGDLVNSTMETIDDYEGQSYGANSMFAPLAITDPRLLANNAQSMEVFRQFQQTPGNLFDFFTFL